MFGTGRTFPIYIVGFFRFPGLFIVVEMVVCRDLVCVLSPEPEEGFCADFCVHSDIWSCLKEVCSVLAHLGLSGTRTFKKFQVGA